MSNLAASTFKEEKLFKARVEVTLKEKILDPQGKAIESSLHNLSFSTLNRVRTGKNIEMFVSETSLEKAISTVQMACEKLLANPVTEDYECEMLSDGGVSLAHFSNRDKSPVMNKKVG